MHTDTRLIVGEGGAHGLSHVRPIDLSTTYRTPDPVAAMSSMQGFAAGAAEAANPIYERLANPNCREFEERMTGLEEGADSVCFASGMAAVAALVLESQSRGSHIVAVPPLYGGTYHLLASGLLGSRVTWAAAAEVREALKPDTALVLLETPSNPLLTVTDIERLVHDAQSVPVAVDSTFATPILQQPLRHGAEYAIHSATKFIGGHGDAMGGVVTTRNPDTAMRLRQVRIATGAILHPIAAHLFCRGIQTLGLRVRAQQEIARQLAVRLQAHSEVNMVGYPGLSGRDHAVVDRQMAGPGTMITIRLDGGAQRADQFITHLRIAVPAVSLGAVDTLVQRPASLTHQAMGEEERGRLGIPEDLIRISVGAEHLEDLWEDLRSSLEATACSGVTRVSELVPR